MRRIETIELFLLAVGISLDTFIVMSISGVMLPSIKAKDILKVGILFGEWQAFIVLLTSELTQRLILLASYVEFISARRSYNLLAMGIFILLGFYMFWKGH